MPQFTRSSWVDVDSFIWIIFRYLLRTTTAEATLHYFIVIIIVMLSIMEIIWIQHSCHSAVSDSQLVCLLALIRKDSKERMAQTFRILDTIYNLQTKLLPVG